MHFLVPLAWTTYGTHHHWCPNWHHPDNWFGYAAAVGDRTSCTGAAIFLTEQRNDPEALEMITYLSDGQLPDCNKKTRKIITQASLLCWWMESCITWTPTLVVVEHIHWCCATLLILSRMCNCQLGSSQQASTLPYTSTTYVLDSGSGCDGLAKDRSRQQTHSCFPGLPVKVVADLRCAWPKAI